MSDHLDLPVTFHGATAEFIELVKQQAADPQKLTTEQRLKLFANSNTHQMTGTASFRQKLLT